MNINWEVADIKGNDTVYACHVLFMGFLYNVPVATIYYQPINKAYWLDLKKPGEIDILGPFVSPSDAKIRAEHDTQVWLEGAGIS